MCQAAAQTAAAVMAGIEPTFKAVLSLEGLTSTPNGQSAIAAYNAALAALQAWKSGTPSQDVVQLLIAFQTIFATLPLPTNIVTFVNIILGGVVTVIGIVKANSPAPTPVVVVGAHLEDLASDEDLQAHYAAQVAIDTEAQVKVLVPTLKRSLFHSPVSQYKKAWNEAVVLNPQIALPKV